MPPPPKKKARYNPPTYRTSVIFHDIEGQESIRHKSYHTDGSGTHVSVESVSIITPPLQKPRTVSITSEHPLGSNHETGPSIMPKHTHVRHTFS